jgi:dihydrofolate reductase
VDELAITVAPVVLSGGKRLFEGFERDLDLEILAVRHSSYAVHTRYAVLR